MSQLGSRGYVAWEDDTIAPPLRFVRTLKSSFVALPGFAQDLPGNGGLSAPPGYAFLSTSPSMISFAIVGSESVRSSFSRIIVAFMLLLAHVFAYSAYLAVWPLTLYWSARSFGVQGLGYRALLRIVCYASGLNVLMGMRKRGNSVKFTGEERA